MAAGGTCLVRVRTEAEVLDSLAGVLWATEEEGVGTSWGTHSELVNGEALTAGGKDARTGSGSEAGGRNGELWDLKETVVVGDGADQDDGLALVLLGGVLVGGGRNNAGDGHWWAVDLAHHQPPQDSLVESGVGTAGQEPVQLDQKGQVDIVRLLDLPVAGLDVVVV